MDIGRRGLTMTNVIHNSPSNSINIPSGPVSISFQVVMTSVTSATPLNVSSTSSSSSSSSSLI